MLTLPAVSIGWLVVQEDVSFAVSPVASHLQTGTDDEQISATQTQLLIINVTLIL